jgi:hypothetical protein
MILDLCYGPLRLLVISFLIIQAPLVFLAAALFLPSFASLLAYYLESCIDHGFGRKQSFVCLEKYRYDLRLQAIKRGLKAGLLPWGRRIG